mgnify:CR=1 FL=1
MKKIGVWWVLVLVLLVSYIGCRKYQGDGAFRKYRIFSNHCQYEVDFGQITLDRIDNRTYQFSGAPSSEYWLCLRIGPVVLNRSQAENLDKVVLEMPEGKAELSLSLFGSMGTVLVQVHSQLSSPSWHWSETRITNFPPQADGTAQFYFNVYPKVDNSDVFFKLRAGERYTMRIATLNPSQNQEHEVELLLQGGFWK